MRHHLGLKKLNRTSSHRQALLRNLSCALLDKEAIMTTLPKAKALRKVVEPLITMAKLSRLEAPTASATDLEKKAFSEYRQAQHRMAFNRLRDRQVVLKLFSDLGPRNATRPGGYIRILKAGFRRGDNAPMAYVELVEKTSATTATASE